MSSSLNQTLERELLARGGVTRGLGPFLRRAYGESDLRRALVEQLHAAVGAQQWPSANAALQLDVSAGGVLPKRKLLEVARYSEVAPWLFRAISTRADRVALLQTVVSRPDTAERFRTLFDQQQDDASQLEATDNTRIAFGGELTELFVAPRPTERARPRNDRKVGRNDPCPCGSAKKFKKCHANDPDFLKVAEATTLDDVAGFPGIGSDQMFWFRNAAEASLADLCKRRLEQGGPRVGETLFWPAREAPDDELVVRVQIAAVEDPEALPKLLSRGLEGDMLTPKQALEQIAVAFPVEGWLDRPPVGLMRALTADAAARLTVAGNITAAQVIALSGDESLRLGWLRDGLSDLGSGNPEPLVCLARALAQAGRPEEAYLALHHCRVSGHPLALDQIHRLRALDKALAAGLGNTPLSEGDWLARDDRATQLARLRSQIKELRVEQEELRAQLTRSEELRARAEKAWTARSDAESPPGEQLRREVRRLKGLLTQEHDKRRGVERNLETMRRRERARLLQQSTVDDAHEASEQATEEVKPEPVPVARGRHVRYHPDFESVAQRLAPSTVARVRQHVEDLAAGRWVREAKRMEGLGNIWTLRAGIHYRALIREGDNVLEVYALIPREELDSTLARLRQ